MKLNIIVKKKKVFCLFPRRDREGNIIWLQYAYKRKTYTTTGIEISYCTEEQMLLDKLKGKYMYDRRRKT